MVCSSKFIWSCSAEHLIKESGKTKMVFKIHVLLLNSLTLNCFSPCFPVSDGLPLALGWVWRFGALRRRMWRELNDMNQQRTLGTCFFNGSSSCDGRSSCGSPGHPMDCGTYSYCSAAPNASFSSSWGRVFPKKTRSSSLTINHVPVKLWLLKSIICFTIYFLLLSLFLPRFLFPLWLQTFYNLGKNVCFSRSFSFFSNCILKRYFSRHAMWAPFLSNSFLVPA